MGTSTPQQMPQTPPVIGGEALPRAGSARAARAAEQLHAGARLPRPELSVVVPVHDEAPNIEPLLREIEAALDGVADYEIVYVDDGSADGTLARLHAAAPAHPRLRIVHHDRSCGQSTAIHTGVRFARAPLVATLDGDGQNDPADIPRLLAAMRAPDRPPRLELIAGQRARRHDGLVRRVSSRVANGVRRRMLRDATPDTGCGLKLFPRDV
ncbi:MAG TPA: glycosyltransferase family 2 protein, partial [Gemmatimonadaceae bacterium]|nr:glycosyltransferase family 2 protein [Gemmatimonadaceae bacterium]